MHFRELQYPRAYITTSQIRGAALFTWFAERMHVLLHFILIRSKVNLSVQHATDAQSFKTLTFVHLDARNGMIERHHSSECEK
jgi:hypothetical protein